MSLTQNLKNKIVSMLNSPTQHTTGVTACNCYQCLQMMSGTQQSISTAAAHTQNNSNVFIGHGQTNTVGSQNTFIGRSAGHAWPNISSLTPEEMKELQLLDEEFKRELKLTKINYFKSLPVETRQYIVCAIIWNKEVVEMENIENKKKEEMSDRHKDLTARRSNMFNVTSAYNSVVNYTYSLQQWLPSLGGLSIEEILSAHNDACAEEALTSV